MMQAFVEHTRFVCVVLQVFAAIMTLGHAFTQQPQEGVKMLEWYNSVLKTPQRKVVL